MILNTSIQEKMNRLGANKIPFLFIIDFEGNEPIVLPLKQVNNREILFSINGNTNASKPIHFPNPLKFKKTPPSFKTFQKAFNNVQDHLKFGNSYLVNLTFPSKIETNWSFQDIFHYSKAKYKLFIEDKMVVFSPEIFVQIKDGIISSNPMKGTINAQIENAAELILTDPKEQAEHHTIVDLIRNDLGRVAEKVHVEKFRYIDKIQTNENELLQVSSKITGVLPENYHSQIGSILNKLLPAGSISGAPKAKTIEIINESEIYERGFYTGIFGIFDGQNLDSGVMIRYIEKTNNGLVFKSGGGITVFSEVKKEYQELKDKIYVPIDRKYQDSQRKSLQSPLSQPAP